MPQILLIAYDWSARALLRAQLIEEGFDTEACDTVESAVRRLWTSKTLPLLLIADLNQSENPAENIAQLSEWSKLLPIWVMASHSFINAKELEDRGFEKILFRPLDIGQLIQQIKKRLAT